MKNIILTGASDGLGKEFAKTCIENNINIIALCRTKPRYDCIHIYTDLADENSIKNSCEEIKRIYNKFDALVNCAGIASVEKIEEINYSSLENVMKVNTIAPMFIISELFDLIKQNNADIINVGSTVGTKSGYENQLAYTTSKWALRGASYNLQLELKKCNCRVIQFNVGGMNTRIVAKVTGEEIKNSDEWMDPADIGKLILYILTLPKKIEVSEITINRKNIK